MITVQVFSRSSGGARASARVGISIGNDGVKTEYTDDSGSAHFDYPPQQYSEVYVDDRTVYSGRLEGRTVVYV